MLAKVLKIFFINFFGLILLIALLEGFFILNTKTRWINYNNKSPALEYRSTDDVLNHYKINFNEISEKKWTYPNLDSSDLKNLTSDDLDYTKKYGAPFPIKTLRFSDATGVVKLKKSELVIYKTEYNFNSAPEGGSSFRKSNFADPKAAQFALHFGDSYIFGEGLDQKDTLTSQLNQKQKVFNNYNFGIPASAPNEFVYMLTNGTDHRNQLVKEKTGILFYHFLPFHMQRLVGTMRGYAPNRPAIPIKPEYKMIANEPTLIHNHFSDRQPLSSIYALLAKSELVAFFNMDIPSGFNREDYELMVSLVAKGFVIYRQRLNVHDGYLVLHPYLDPAAANFIKDAAKKRGLNVLDYSDLNVTKLLGTAAWQIPIDSHPTANYYNLIAQLMLQDLEAHNEN